MKPKPVVMLSESDTEDEASRPEEPQHQQTAAAPEGHDPSTCKDSVSLQRQSLQSTPTIHPTDQSRTSAPNIPPLSPPLPLSRKRKASTIDTADPNPRENRGRAKLSSSIDNSTTTAWKRTKPWMPRDAIGAATANAAWKTLTQRTGMTVSEDGKVSRPPQVSEAGQGEDLRSQSQPHVSGSAPMFHQNPRSAPPRTAGESPVFNPQTGPHFPPGPHSVYGPPPYPASSPQPPQVLSAAARLPRGPLYQNPISYDLRPLVQPNRLPSVQKPSARPAFAQSMAPHPCPLHIPNPTYDGMPILPMPTPTQSRWTTNVLTNFAMTLQRAFPFARFAHDHNIPVNEVFSVFSALVHSPILDFPRARKRVEEWKGSNE